MRQIYTLAAAMAVALAAGPVLGQSLLKQFEKKAKAPSAAAPAADPATTAAPGFLGVDPVDTPEPGKGVLLSGVRQGAPSDQGGLKSGDIITAIDGKPCRNLDDLDAVLAKSKVGTKLTVTVQRAGKPETKVITLGSRPIEAAPAENPGEAPPTDPLPTPSRPALPGTTRPATPPADVPSRPGSDPLADPLGDPAGRPPSLRPGAEPAAPLDDPLFRPRDRDPALDLPAPPTDDKPADDKPADESPAPGIDSPSTDPPAPGASGRASLGIQVVPLNDETRAQYNLRTSARQGAVIVSVRPGSAADSAGLPIGGVVVSIDGQLVKTSDDLVEAISAARPGQEVELRYYQGERLLTRPVRLAPAAARAAVPARSPRPDVPLDNSDRPLLRKLEDVVGSLGPAGQRPNVGSTILDPSRLAEMHEDIKAMREKLDALETRVKELEGKANP